MPLRGREENENSIFPASAAFEGYFHRNRLRHVSPSVTSVPNPAEQQLKHLKLSTHSFDSALQQLQHLKLSIHMRDRSCNSYPHGCPCGFYNDPVKECTCSAMAIARYQKRISGSLLDRIDIHVEVPGVDYEKLSAHVIAHAYELSHEIETALDQQGRLSFRVGGSTPPLLARFPLTMAVENEVPCQSASPLALPGGSLFP